MKKETKIFDSNKKWQEAGRPKDSYIKQKIGFEIKCLNCGSLATLYENYAFEYGISHLIRCDKCGKERGLYGVDG